MEDEKKLELRVAGVVVAIALIGATIALVFCNIHYVEVPAGNVGYLVDKPLVFGRGGFVDTRTGPSRELMWRTETTNVSTMQFTIDEEFDIVAKDDLTISFHAHAMLQVDKDKVRQVAETYFGEKWYEEFFQERFRSAVYDAVREHTSREAKENRAEVGKKVETAMRTTCDGTPFIVHQIVIGNVQYPESIQKAIQSKIAATQELEQAATRVLIAQQEALIKIEEAKGLSEAQKIINGTLTDLYVRHEAVSAMGKASSVIYVPVGNDGLPIVRVTP